MYTVRQVQLILYRGRILNFQSFMKFKKEFQKSKTVKYQITWTGMIESITLKIAGNTSFRIFDSSLPLVARDVK